MTKRAKISVAGVLFLLILCNRLLANNLSISNGKLTSQNASAGTINVQFDLSWSNSWRDSTNYDAVWIFMKYSTNSGVTWRHAALSGSGTNPSGFSVGTGTFVQILVPFDEMGCFIQRAGNGTGTLSAQQIQLVWDYKANGINDTDANGLNTRVKIFGIEMVYVPQGSFLAGDSNGGLTAHFKAGKKQNLPISINSEDAVVFNAADSGPYYYQSGSNTDEYSSGSVFTVPSNFPKGFNAFYLMKYEISQGQWINFFNTLTDSQKTARDITSASGGGKNSETVVYRNAVSWSSGDAALVNSREFDRACNYLSWQDLCAFADWAALRPITELEFEKACRGPAAEVDGEFAWGNSLISAAITIIGTESGTETITTSGANACYNNVTFTGGDGGQGPLRCGIFATASSDRAASGAGYYGNMELSGNLWERCVTVGNAYGLNFTGTHGDGTLTGSGNATNIDWPGIDAVPANGVTGAAGSGFKGGSWNEANISNLAVGDRIWAARADTNRNSKYGGRCGRSAY